MTAGIIGLGLVLLMLGIKNQGFDPARPTITPSRPTNVPSASSQGDKAGGTPKAEPSAGVAPDLTPGPGGVVISDDRRKHILDGDATGGGHRPGQNAPGKSEFPPGWSDERIVDAIKGVATDPSSSRKPGRRGRIVVNGSREGVDIEVVIEGDGKTVITGYPTNGPRNPK